MTADNNHPLKSASAIIKDIRSGICVFGLKEERRQPRSS